MVNYFCPQMKFGARLCFYTCLWFCSESGGMSGQVPTPGQVHPQQVHSPPGQVHPGRYTPQAGTPQAGTPPAGTPPQAGTPPGLVHPPGQVHTPLPSTSGRYASYWNAFLLELCSKSWWCIQWINCQGIVVVRFVHPCLCCRSVGACRYYVYDA